MSQKSLSTRSLLELIDLFERSSHAVGGCQVSCRLKWDESG